MISSHTPTFSPFSLPENKDSVCRQPAVQSLRGCGGETSKEHTTHYPCYLSNKLPMLLLSSQGQRSKWPTVIFGRVESMNWEELSVWLMSVLKSGVSEDVSCVFIPVTPAISPSFKHVSYLPPSTPSTVSFSPQVSHTLCRSLGKAKVEGTAPPFCGPDRKSVV